MKKLIAVELNIPDEYKDREDAFMADLLAGLQRDSHMVYFYDEQNKEISSQQVSRIFTLNYEFVDPIKGF